MARRPRSAGAAVRHPRGARRDRRRRARRHVAAQRAQPHAAARPGRPQRPGRAAPAARDRARELRRGHRLDGTLEQVRELLDAGGRPRSAGRCSRIRTTALAWPRRNSTRCRRTPPERCGALADYQWRSPEAREKYEQIQELLRSEVLDAQFAGMRDAMQIGYAGGPGARPGHDARAQRDARRRCPRRAHPGAVRRVHAGVRRVLPGPSQQPRRARRLARATRRGCATADGLADARAARRARRADGAGASATPAWPRRWAGCSRLAARGPSGPALGVAASGWAATSRWAIADATGALAELADLDQLDELLVAGLSRGQPRRHRRGAGRTRPRTLGRRPARRSCGGSSASCGSRATCNAPATASS